MSELSWPHINEGQSKYHYKDNVKSDLYKYINTEFDFENLDYKKYTDFDEFINVFKDDVYSGFCSEHVNNLRNYCTARARVCTNYDLLKEIYNANPEFVEYSLKNTWDKSNHCFRNYREVDVFIRECLADSLLCEYVNSHKEALRTVYNEYTERFNVYQQVENVLDKYVKSDATFNDSVYYSFLNKLARENLDCCIDLDDFIYCVKDVFIDEARKSFAKASFNSKIGRLKLGMVSTSVARYIDLNKDALNELFEDVRSFDEYSQKDNDETLFGYSDDYDANEFDMNYDDYEMEF